MTSIPAVLTPHTVTVRPLQGQNAYGPTFGSDTRWRRVRLEGGTRIVRNRDGAEVVSTGRLFTRPTHGPLPPGSLVLIHQGTPLERWAEVLSVSHEYTPPAPEHYLHHLT